MNEIRVGESDGKPTRGWIWAAIFTIMGAIYIYDGIQDPDSSMYRLVMGAGFLLAAPRAFYSPVTFLRLDTRMEKIGVVDWIGMAGVAVLCAGIVMRFL